MSPTRSVLSPRLSAVAARIAAAGVPVSTAGPSGAVEPQVGGVTLDSRAVVPGDLYAALPGSRTHGARFCPQAAAAGAVAVLTDPAGRVAATASGLPTLIVPEPRAVLGALSGWVYGEPAGHLLMLGVTGTNGKTTTTYLLDGMLRRAGRRTGLIGTVETRIVDERIDSVRTTPEAPQLHRLLARMVDAGAQACSMEVSSHALAQHRVDGVVFDVAGFTNLSQDHLDFHPSMADYFAAKARLFTPQHARRGVVSVDDEWGRQLAAAASIPVVTVSMADASADWVVTEQRPGGPAIGTGVGFTLRDPSGAAMRAHCPLPGEFNVANAALALVMLVVAGMSAAEVVGWLAGAEPVPGRLEPVPGTGEAGEPLGVVDYAHTPAAVEAALHALRPGTPGRLVIVLGAGGDRDPGKRAAMGAAAAAAADVLLVTDDNPRSEPAEQIRAAVLSGARDAVARGESRCQVLEVPDRLDAILTAVRLGWAASGPSGTVLVAGKGHETGQQIHDVVHPFDDRKQLRAALETIALGHQPGAELAAPREPR